MSSTRRVQTERALQETVYSLYSKGVIPTLSSIRQDLSNKLSKDPAGSPYSLPEEDALATGVSNPKAYNALLKNLAKSLSVLYEASLDQVQDVLDLNAYLQQEVDRLKARRKRVSGKIDDFLLAMHNTEGYFASVSDGFYDIAFTDLYLTSAFVDTIVSAVALPSVSSMTTNVNKSIVGNPSIQVSVNGSESTYPFEEISPFWGALEDGMNNTAWAFEVETSAPKEVVVTVTIPIGTRDNPVQLSKIDFTPYGTIPVQMFVETSNGNLYEDFGKKIQTSNQKMAFHDEERFVTSIKITLRKTEPDYTVAASDRAKYRYIFGARSITLTQQYFERFARFVSTRLDLPQSENQLEYSIDGVSLTVKEEIPPDCSMEYFVALDTEGSEELEEFDWRRIYPISADRPGEGVIHFGGADTFLFNINHNPSSGELQQIPLSSEGAVEDRNPSPSIIPGVDVYQIAKLENEQILPGSMSLFEGVNTTRIYSKPIDPLTPWSKLTLDDWNDVFNGTSLNATTDYGQIKAGNEFFYGGDVGVSDRHVLVETFVECEETLPPILAEFQKIDERSRTWPVRIYHNGQEIGYLPVGVDTLRISWQFRKGRNHIILMLEIPPDDDISNIYAGTLSLMGDKRLVDFGSVFLDKWSYVDFFTMKYNQTGEPKSFTLHEGYIISRRKPTTNYRFIFSQKSIGDMTGLRFRADLSRSSNNASTSPLLHEYRLRFSYGNQEG